MNKICTSIEQSKRLIELGFDASTADMKWFIPADDEGIEEVSLIECQSEYRLFDKVTNWNDTPYIPAWSLSALLYLLENPQLFNHDDFWRCDGYTTVGYCHDNAIDAAFEVVEVEAEKVQKGTKKPGIKRSILKNKQLYHET